MGFVFQFQRLETTVKFCDRLLKAYRVGVPLVTLETSDPVACVHEIKSTFVPEDGPAVSDTLALVMWDCAAGLRAINERGNIAIGSITGGADPAAIRAPVDMLNRALKGAPADTLIFAFNMHRFLGDTMVIQAVSNLRDKFKADGRMLIMLGTTFRTPAELQHDVLAITEPLPSEAQLTHTIRELTEELELPDVVIDKAAAATIGVTRFAAENLTAMALDRNSSTKIDLDALWESKRKKIDETPGLRVVTNAGGFDALGGLSAAKEFMTGILKGNNAPRCIVHVDEIEKAWAGLEHDSSGVTQDQFGVWLTWMQENNATGIIANGPTGSGKSAFARAAGSAGDVPTIQFDLGGLKNSKVGQSESNTREALQVIQAISGGNTLWVATCNSMAALPPELRRRFKLGVWFFDLPNLEERTAIWKLYAKRYDLSDDAWAGLVSREWTGAEIESCCDVAWRIGCTLEQAAHYVVPVSISCKEEIEKIRQQANGRYLSASRPGPYAANGTTTQQRGRRRLGEDN